MSEGVDADRDAGRHRWLGGALLVLYTVAALGVPPFAVVLALYTPMLFGGAGNTSHPLVPLTYAFLLGLPLLLLVGTVAAWTLWLRRRERAALIAAAIPALYGALVLAVLVLVIG